MAIAFLKREGGDRSLKKPALTGYADKHFSREK